MEDATVPTGRFLPDQNPFPFSGLSKSRQEGECLSNPDQPVSRLEDVPFLGLLPACAMGERMRGEEHVGHAAKQPITYFLCHSPFLLLYLCLKIAPQNPLPFHLHRSI